MSRHLEIIIHFFSKNCILVLLFLHYSTKVVCCMYNEERQDLKGSNTSEERRDGWLLKPLKFKLLYTDHIPLSCPKRWEMLPYTHISENSCLLLFSILTAHSSVSGGQQCMEQELLGGRWWYSTSVNTSDFCQLSARLLTTHILYHSSSTLNTPALQEFYKNWLLFFFFFFPPKLLK